MDISLKGKKLLLVGGIQRTCVIVKRAQELGAYVVVADYDPESPAKKIADEAVLIDAKDVDALTEYSRKNQIDGLFTAYVDFLLPVCKEVSKRIGKPFYATDLMIEMATDKNSFKKHCEAYQVPVPKTYAVSLENYREDARKLQYPVFIKPVDASGSRGADICYDPDDFCKKYEYALSFSKRKDITVEDYLSGTEFILDYVLVDGEIYMVSMADRFTTEGRTVAINNPNLMILPSAHLEKYYQKVDPKVRAMFKGLGFQNGVIFLQGYIKGDKITFYEMGCRFGGSWPYIAAHYSGINIIDMLLSYNLNGQMLPSGKTCETITPFFNGLAAIIYFTSAIPQGDIAQIKGIDEIKQIPEVVCTIQYYYEGDHFALGTLTDVLFLAVHIVGTDYMDLKKMVEKVYSMVDYLDKEGHSLIMPVINMDEVTENGTYLYKVREEEKR